MDPLTLALISAGGTALTQVPSMLKSQSEKDNQKELAEMKRRQEMGTLGLTDEERRQLEEQYAMKTSASQRQAEAERKRLLQSGGGLSGGQALLAEAALTEAEAGAQQAAQQAVEQANLMEAQREEQQIRDLQATIDEQKLARREAMASPFLAGAQSYVGQMGVENLLSGGMSAAEAAGIRNIQAEMGLDQQEATKQLMYLKQNNKKMYDFYTNPDAMSYMSMIGGL